MNEIKRHPVFSAGNETEYLAVTLCDKKNSILIRCSNRNGTQIGFYRNGFEEQTYCVEEERRNHIHGYLEVYNKLGPELRKRLPAKWKEMLGTWLMSPEQKRAERECLEHLAEFPVLGPESIGREDYLQPHAK
jgi:hypothetical protein